MTNTCVVIVSYHGAADTVLCLTSLASSTVQVESVVVDTTPYDAALQPAIGKFANVKLIQADENLGFGRGNNLGIRWALHHTQCDYIFLLNNDASVLPDSIAILEAAMAAQQDVDVLTPRIAYRDEPGKLWYGGGVMDWRRASAFTPGFNGPIDAASALLERNVTFASGCALFVRRAAMIKVGGFDPRFFMYEEDVEWCLKASSTGHIIRYLPTSLVLHKAQGSSRDEEEDRGDFWSTKNPKLTFYAFHIIRNRMLNIYEYAHGIEFVQVLLFFPLFLIRRAIPFLLGGRVDAVFAMFMGAADSWKFRNSPSSEEL